MKQNVKALLLSTVFIAAGAMSANAGGLIEPGGYKDGGYSAPAPVFAPMGGGSLKDAPMAAPAQTGWYFRGDIGYSHYGNVDAYTGEHEMYVGSNQLGTDGRLVGDFDGSCQLNSNGDLRFSDRGYVYDADGDRLYSDGNYYPDDVTAQAADAANITVTNFKDADGNAIEADGYYYFTDPSTGASIARYNPQAIVGTDGAALPRFDAAGNAVGNVADGLAVDGVNGNSAGIWEQYDKVHDTWVNVAAVYHDNSGDLGSHTDGVQTVMVWDKTANGGAGGWGHEDGFNTQTIIDVVRDVTGFIPAGFLKNSAGDLGLGREQAWLQQAVTEAGRSVCNIGRNALTSAEIDNTWTLGAGVGYYFSNHWRGDLTFDYRFGSAVRTEEDCLDEWGQTNFHLTRKSELSSFVTLANLYYDFGDRNGFTPYIGAGIGFSVNTLDDYTQDCLDSNSHACAKNHSGQGDTTTDIAAAAMVGFTQSLGRNMKLDVGYRYLYMGDAQSGNELAGPETSQGRLEFDDLTAHEVRVGLRFDFGGCGTGSCR